MDRKKFEIDIISILIGLIIGGVIGYMSNESERYQSMGMRFAKWHTLDTKTGEIIVTESELSKLQSTSDTKKKDRFSKKELDELFEGLSIENN